MAEIINVYKQGIPAMRFIGKKYTQIDMKNDHFHEKWNEWFSNDWFYFEKEITESFKEQYKDWNSYIGLIRWQESVLFEYWIGMFMPKMHSIPEGYNHIDFLESTLGVCWVYGAEWELFYPRDGKFYNKFNELGYTTIPDQNGVFVFLERYACPRFTTQDSKGNVILDICHFIEQNEFV